MIAPARIATPHPLLRGAIQFAWLVALLWAVVAQFGGTWINYQRFVSIDAPFASIGLQYELNTEDGWGVGVHGLAGVAQSAAILPGSLLGSINGVSIDGQTPVGDVAEMIANAGPTVDVAFFSSQGWEHLQLKKSEVSTSYRVMALFIDPLLQCLAALFCFWVSVLLIMRRGSDPVALLVAFGLVGLVLIQGLPEVFANAVLPDAAVFLRNAHFLLALVPLLVAMPAFPDGVYRPRAGGLLAIVAPLAAIFVVINSAGLIAQLDWQVSNAIFVALTIATVAATIQRFRLTAPGAERQQLKWAMAGLVFGLPAIAIAETLAASLSLQGAAGYALSLASTILEPVGATMIALGLLMSLMGWRLNDADGAFGQSAGYGVVTLVIGALWTMTTSWTNTFLGAWLGGASATGLSTMLATAVFVPARERILAWTERKFQPALVRLRSLPGRLQPWKHDHEPADIARGTLLAIVNGVNASSAALVLTEGGEMRVLAVVNTDENAVLDALATGDDPHGSFPLRLVLDDLIGPVGLLLLGPRSDGASYRADERKAVGLIENPLAEALRATSRRSQRNSALSGLLTSVEARVSQLESGLARV